MHRPVPAHLDHVDSTVDSGTRGPVPIKLETANGFMLLTIEADGAGVPFVIKRNHAARVGNVPLVELQLLPVQYPDRRRVGTKSAHMSFLVFLVVHST